MPVPSRRSILRAGLLGAGALALGSRVSYPQREQPTLRHDVASPEGAAMLRIFAEAVGKMMALPEGDLRGWAYQWRIHAVPDDRSKASELARLYPNMSDPGRALAEAVWDTCEAHFDPLRVNFFLPWHRMHLMAFERLVRSITGAAHFTMPYWNHTDPDHRALPPQFRSPGDPQWKPLFRTDRNPGVNDGRPIDQAGEAPLGLNAMMSPVYADTFDGDAGFCANLDNAPHSAVHVDVGTRERGMGAVSWAANDPIFWLHHCNLDRIWASWNRAGGRNPSDGSYLGRVFTFVEGAGEPLRIRVADVLDTTALGYAYDDYLDRPLGSGPTTVRLGADGGSGRHFGRLRAASAAGRPFYLRVAGVLITKQPGVSYEVHLDPAPFATLPDHSSRSYVGTINVFGAVIRGTHTGPGPAPYTNPRNYSFVITDLVQDLVRAGRLARPPSVMLIPTGRLRPCAAPTVDDISLVSS